MTENAGTWWHDDGTECVAGHYADTMLCAEGGGIVRGDHAAAQVARVRTLHGRQDKPVQSRKVCDRHGGADGLKALRLDWKRAEVESCPDCEVTEYYVCRHCQCPNDAWPCPTIRALEGAGAFLR